jgi:predicted phage terminase large subunit-like protein
MNKYLLCDPAGEQRKSNDFTSMWVIGLGTDGNYYWLDGVRDRLNLPERGKEIMRLHRKWKPYEVRYERYGMMADVQYIKELQERDNYRFDVTEVAGNKLKKEDRIRRLLPIFSEGKFYCPESMFYTDREGVPHELVTDFTEQELCAFPAGIHDDMLDSLSRIVEPDLSLVWPMSEEEPKEKDRYARKKQAYHSPWAA